MHSSVIHKEICYRLTENALFLHFEDKSVSVLLRNKLCLF